MECKSTRSQTCSCGPECKCHSCKCSRSEATASKKGSCPETCACESLCKCTQCSCELSDAAAKVKKAS